MIYTHVFTRRNLVDAKHRCEHKAPRKQPHRSSSQRVNFFVSVNWLRVFDFGSRAIIITRRASC